MALIQPLPPTLLNQITVGDVVECSASIVKELLESSVDGGTCIDSDVRNGGSDLIQIVDNGCSIQADDLPLTFDGHATGKLHRVEALFRIDKQGTFARESVKK